MRHLHSILMAVVILLVSSCATKSDIEDLQSQLNELKTGKIASIEQQITSIQASITSLQATDTQLSAFVSTLQLETSNIKADLSAKEKALSDRIDELKKYTDDELGKTKDWVSATFATLEQYQAVLNDLAEIKESIKTLDKDLRKEIEDSIKASEESMKGWVNEQLAGYYTIAQMDVKLKALQDADKANADAIDKVASDLETAKTELTEAYKKAIEDAITNAGGNIDEAIIKAATKNLEDKISNLSERVSALETDIKGLIARIQSINFLSLNSEDIARLSLNGKDTLIFDIYPRDAAKALAEAGPTAVAIKAITDKTKALVNDAYLTIQSTGFEDGYFYVVTNAQGLDKDAFTSGAINKAELVINHGQTYMASPIFHIAPIKPKFYYTTTDGSPIGINECFFDVNPEQQHKLEDGCYVVELSKVPSSLSKAFSSRKTLRSIRFENFDTSNVINMSYMFDGCSSLTSLDLSGFDTSNVTDMHCMFDGCSNLTSLDLSGFDTSKVTDMFHMFLYCSKLTSLDLSGFDTSNVTDMSSMFYGCSKLTSLDLSGFDTSKVTDMSYMFYNCSSLTSLDLSGFDTRNVTDMNRMFYGCSKLTSLRIPNTKVTLSDNSFSGVPKLTLFYPSGYDPTPWTQYLTNGYTLVEY